MSGRKGQLKADRILGMLSRSKNDQFILTSSYRGPYPSASRKGVKIEETKEYISKAIPPPPPSLQKNE